MPDSSLVSVMPGDVLTQPPLYDGLEDRVVFGARASPTFNVNVAVEVVELPPISNAFTYQVCVPAVSGDVSVYASDVALVSCFMAPSI